MTWLRSRRTMQVLVALLVFCLIASLGYGFVTTRDAPEPLEPGQEPAPAPSLDVLGASPRGVEYHDLGEECTQYECYRVVGLAGADTDAAGAIDAVYTTLLDRGFQLMLPPGEGDPADVDWVDATLVDGEVMVQGSEQAPAQDTVAHLVIVHAGAAQ